MGTVSEEVIHLNGIYKHFKGNLYKVIAVATHTETNEYMIVYTSLNYGKVWVRPFKMFTEEVTRDGKTFKRFEYLRNDEPGDDILVKECNEE